MLPNLIINNMRNLRFFAVLALTLTLAYSQMSFDLNSASYQSVGGFWDLNIPVKGGVSPLRYNFQELPSLWYQQDNNLQIPSAFATVGGTRAIKVIVSDGLGNTLRRSLLIKISGGSIYIGDYPYDQTFSFTDSGQATVSPSSSTFLTSSITRDTQSSTVSDSVVGDANSFGKFSSTAGVTNLQVSGKGANTALPTDSQLDTLINSGDSVSITQTVQRVISSSLSCTQKTGYLNDFLGRINSYIAIKQTVANQLNNIIVTNQNQITSLNNQIANYTASINNLGIPALQGQLTNILFSLQLAYDQYNKANVDLTPYKLNITANGQSINTLSATLTKTKNQLKADNQSLSDTLDLIKALEAQLATANKNKEGLQARILVTVNNITSLQTQIDFLNADNVKLNNQITQITNNEEILRNKYQSLQTSAQNLKNTVSAYQAQQAQYTSQISILKSQIQQSTLNLDPTNLNAVLQTISNLNATIPSLKQQIDYVRFNCNGVVNYTVTTLDGTITYTFGSSVFSTYVTNQFGQVDTNAAQKLLGPISKVTLTPITVFTPSWISQFGQSFVGDLKSINATAVTPNSYFFTSDFSCTGTNLQQGSGVVKQIVANYITVTLANGSTATVILGACSNILLLNQSAPKIGNNIYWSGLSLGSSTYNAYSALLF